jgi:peptidoglycan/xylan/chitin deacetylase (PgdA/CDA1 family)
VSPRYVLKTLAGLVALAVICPIRDRIRSLLRRHPVRIFTFHRVSDLCRDGMTVSPEAFRRQLAYLRRHHDVVPFDEALRLAVDGARLERPVAAISFDDAYASVFSTALPLMTEAGAVGSCFVSTGLIGDGSQFEHDADNPLQSRHLRVMTWTQLAILRDLGWTVGAHTMTHARLSLCDPTRLNEELGHSLTALRSRLGLGTIPFAYPFGRVSDITVLALEKVRELGYTACLANDGGENVPPRDRYDMCRIELGGDHPTLAWRTRSRGMDLGAIRLRPRWLEEGATRAN